MARAQALCFLPDSQVLQKRSRIRTDEDFCRPSLGQSARLDWHPRVARRGPRGSARSTQTGKHTAQENALIAARSRAGTEDAADESGDRGMKVRSVSRSPCKAEGKSRSGRHRKST